MATGSEATLRTPPGTPVRRVLGDSWEEGRCCRRLLSGCGKESQLETAEGEEARFFEIRGWVCLLFGLVFRPEPCPTAVSCPRPKRTFFSGKLPRLPWDVESEVTDADR